MQRCKDISLRLNPDITSLQKELKLVNSTTNFTNQLKRRYETASGTMFNVDFMRTCRSIYFKCGQLQELTSNNFRICCQSYFVMYGTLFLTYFIDLSYGWGLGKRFIQGKGTHKWVREEGGAWVRNIFYYI